MYSPPAAWLPIGVGVAHLVCACTYHLVRNRCRCLITAPRADFEQAGKLYNASIPSVTSRSSGQILSLVSCTTTTRGIETWRSCCANVA